MDSLSRIKSDRPMTPRHAPHWPADAGLARRHPYVQGALRKDPSMPAPAAPASPPSVAPAKVGVLLVNLGSPAGYDAGSVRRYLRQFLSDPRVIEIARPVWFVILNGFVLTTRPKKSGHAYGLVWNRERNEAPLVTITRAQSEKLAATLAGEGIVVDWAMRYGEPSIDARLRAMKDVGCERILLAPLYPQYAASTTATANDDAFATLMQMRWQPAIRTLPPYHDDPVYIDALAEAMTEDLAKLDFEPELVIASFHGLPKSYIDKGDPYARHCRETVELLRARLGWGEDRLRLTFQSRFGRAEWLQPYTDVTLEKLATEGVRRVAVVTPGFSADCLETLEEIAIRGGETFREAGGTHYAALPCLNDRPMSLRLLEHLARRELKGWLG
jgi:ferrochelatase